MCEVLGTGGITKRQFMKYCLLGMGGIAVGLHRSDAIAAVARKFSSTVPVPDGLWKWSKEAVFYTQTARGVRCLKCPNECELGANETGRCRNRVNYQGKMYTIAYGNPCAVHIDPVEKKPLFHFLPSTRAFSIATAGCNLACLNCQNWQISQVSPRETDNVDLMPPAAVDRCLQERCESIAYTYAEPDTFYEYAYDTAKLARERGIRNIWKSSGYINEEPLRKVSKYIDAANIDLKSFDDRIYGRLSSAKLAPVLRTLKVFKEEGVWLEITNLVIPSWTDDLDMIKRMCDWLCTNGLSECPLHLSRFVPLYKLTHLPTTPVSTLEKAMEIAKKSGVRYVYIGNVPGHMAENTYCPKCAKMIVERKGFSILRNDIVGSKCRFCGEKIAGVWT
jgi:pyruvate formate lyase activating enzyme